MVLSYFKRLSSGAFAISVEQALQDAHKFRVLMLSKYAAGGVSFLQIAARYSLKTFTPLSDVNRSVFSPQCHFVQSPLTALVALCPTF